MTRVRLILTGATALFVAIVAVVASNGPETYALVVEVPDAGDLRASSPVQVSDVQVGTVESVELVLAGSETAAVVTLAIDADVRIPIDVTARLRRTSVLGERVIELRPDGPLTTGPFLADGDRIERSEIVADVEQVAESGSELLGGIAVSHVATIFDEGATALSGRGNRLRSMLTDLGIVLDAYAQNTDSIEGLILSLDSLGQAVGPAAETHARFISSLEETTRLLSSEKDRLVGLVQSLNDLGGTTASLVEAHLADLEAFLDELVIVGETLAAGDGLLVRDLIEGLSKHLTAWTVTDDGEVTVLVDLIVCDVEGGGERLEWEGTTCRPEDEEIHE